jgi:hypothetical protein
VARSDPFPTATREPGIGPALSLKGWLSVGVGPAALWGGSPRHLTCPLPVELTLAALCDLS